MKIPTMVTMSLIGALGEISGVNAGKRNKNISGRSENKVQTPEKRLKKLNAKSKVWLIDHIKTPNEGDSEGRKKFRLDKYNAVIKNIENKTTMMLRVYNAENHKGEKRCGYFDATVTNGGPQAFQPQLNTNKVEARKSYLEERQNEDNRQARHLLADQLGIDMKSDEQEKIHERRLLARIHDFSHIHNKLLELERWFRNHVDFETYLGLDFADEDENDRHRRSADKKKQRTFSAPHIEWRKITTGYRKWAERYIKYCHSQYVEQKYSKWANDKLKEKITTLYKDFNDIE